MTVRVARRERASRARRVALGLAALVGLMAGLFYAWFVNPVEYVDVEPERLGEEQRRTYVVLVSMAYASDGDLARARVRLAGLGLSNAAGQAVAEAADEALAQGVAETSVRALANLALALGGEPGAALTFAGTLAPPPTLRPTSLPVTSFVQTAVPTPLLTSTPFPTVTLDPQAGTLTPTLAPVRDAYALVDRDSFCDPSLPPGVLVVIVQDEGGDGLPGREVVVAWEGGQDSFFTGLKPEQGPGYADFVMAAGREYTVSVVEDGTSLSEEASGVETEPCLPDGEEDERLSGFQVVFRRR